jgi:putative transcriptional regulator
MGGLRAWLLLLLVPGILLTPAAAVEPEADSGLFLVASEKLLDPNFHHAVVLICYHDDSGSIGVVVNQQTRHKLADILPEEMVSRKNAGRLYLGGPVERDSIVFLMRSETQPEHAIKVIDSLYLSGDITLLRRTLNLPTPVPDLRVFAGYAGWGAGQLEQEIDLGAWHVLQADPWEVLNKSPERVWHDLIRMVNGLWVRGEDCRIPDTTPGAAPVCPGYPSGTWRAIPDLAG